jgi:S-DNA-T family DNA segregation ATPase FtsK/SpoIIIE
MESNLTNITLPLTLGSDPTTNEPISIDLGKCGNILLVGATKQGKSHCIHNLIRQIETLTTPPKLILFDPKRCEFSQYKERYMVIDSSSNAVDFLLSVICEHILVKDVSTSEPSHSSYVLVIDEIYDLISMKKSRSMKNYSDYLCYMAIINILIQGPEKNIYTIISTQSSDKDILTKKILDNCQTRLAFRTINAQDSRRILKKPGAEDLLGRVEAILYQEGKCRKIQCP